jgi:hypothetical protein
VQEGGKLAIHKVCLLPVCPYFYIWFLRTLNSGVSGFFMFKKFLASTSYLTVILYRITAKYIVVWNQLLNLQVYMASNFFIKLKLFSLI